MQDMGVTLSSTFAHGMPAAQLLSEKSINDCVWFNSSFAFLVWLEGFTFRGVSICGGFMTPAIRGREVEWF